MHARSPSMSHGGASSLGGSTPRSSSRGRLRGGRGNHRYEHTGRPIPRYNDPATPPRFMHDGQVWQFRGGVLDKLTDPALYTGSHKHRFDEEGRGRGAAGRDLGARGAGFGVKQQKVPAGELDVTGAAWAAGLRQGLYSRTPGSAPHHRTVQPYAGRSASRSPIGSAAVKHSVPRQRSLTPPDADLTPLQAQDLCNLDAIEAQLGIPYDPTRFDPADPDGEIAERWSHIRTYYPHPC